MSGDRVEHWGRVAALLDAALERAPIDRSAYLDDACVGGMALRAEVEALLAGAQAPSFLDSTAMTFAAPLFNESEAGDGTSDIPIVRGFPYEFDRTLGCGGMATVYLARDAKHNRSVAIKVLDAELTAFLGAQRFVQEIRLAARLQHPHILGLLDSGVFGAEAGVLAGRPYYIMPYVDGESLRARLNRSGPLPFIEAVRVLREVADALCYAHEQGVVHRDIKPENILLSREHAVVADFGIAKALLASQIDETAKDTASGNTSGTLTELGALVGTPAYMSPEQAAGSSQVDHRADLYAWGVLAYELLAGRHPFKGKTSRHELLEAHTSEMPQPLREIAPGVPSALAAIVMRSLSKAPSERPSSGAAIWTTLDSVSVSTAPAAASGLVSSRRARLATLAALCVLLVLGAVATSAYWRRARAQSTAQPVVVVGTGHPDIDVRAVQAAVDHGGNITLKGHFSFGVPPTKPVASLLASGWYPPAAEVLVSKEVTISGSRDAHGDMTTIESGTIPFYVDARGERVTIRGLRFIRPIADAILVYAVRGVEIATCRIEGVVPFAGGAEAIAINTRGEIPMPASPGNPELVSGHLLIARNDIDAAGGTSRDATEGVMVFAVGQSPNENVDLDIIGNDIRNASGATINVRRASGRVRVLGNRLRTSSEVGIGSNDAVRLVNTGSYLMANNTIECKWANCIGIAVFSQFAEWPIEHAVVEDNDVIMTPPPGTAFGDSSAGINIRGFARGNVIRHNSFRGRARAALAIYVFRGGVPAENALFNNRFDDFKATLADIFVGSGVGSKRVVGPGTIVDQAAGG